MECFCPGQNTTRSLIRHLSWGCKTYGLGKHILTGAELEYHLVERSFAIFLSHLSSLPPRSSSSNIPRPVLFSDWLTQSSLCSHWSPHRVCCCAAVTTPVWGIGSSWTQWVKIVHETVQIAVSVIKTGLGSDIPLYAGQRGESWKIKPQPQTGIVRSIKRGYRIDKENIDKQTCWHQI